MVPLHKETLNSDPEPEATCCKKSWKLVQDTLSTLLTLFAVAVICIGISSGHAALPGHPALLFILFVGVLILLAYLEGLQVAILALVSTDIEVFRTTHPRAYDLATLCSDDTVVQRFLVGRQFFVVFIVFLAAQLTTYTTLRMDFLPAWAFLLLIQTGMPGVLVVLSFGQLMPQLIAARYPATMMNLPGSWAVVQLTLCMNAVGVTNFSWVLTSLVERICKPTGAIKGSMLGTTIMSPVTEARTGDHIIEMSHLSVPAAANLGRSDASSQVQSESVKNNLYTAKQMRKWDKKDSSLPSPPDMCKTLTNQGKPVPRYLLPPNHKEHIPPHVVAYDAIRRNEQTEAKLAKLEHKVCTVLTPYVLRLMRNHKDVMNPVLHELASMLESSQGSHMDDANVRWLAQASKELQWRNGGRSRIGNGSQGSKEPLIG